MPEHTRGPAYELYRRVLQEVALKGWTKSELRKKTGVARSTVEAWATQPRPPQARTVNAVADALGIPRADALRLAGILTDEDPPVPELVRRAVRSYVAGTGRDGQESPGA